MTTSAADTPRTGTCTPVCWETRGFTTEPRALATLSLLQGGEGGAGEANERKHKCFSSDASPCKAFAGLEATDREDQGHRAAVCARTLQAGKGRFSTHLSPSCQALPTSRSPSLSDRVRHRGRALGCRSTGSWRTSPRERGFIIISSLACRAVFSPVPLARFYVLWFLCPSTRSFIHSFTHSRFQGLRNMEDPGCVTRIQGSLRRLGLFVPSSLKIHTYIHTCSEND